jgi:Fe-S oxidoreductase
MHGTELVSRLIAQGRVRMETPIPETISFHDPCYLGRYNGVYDAPRRILESIPGLKLRNFARASAALCCGAGADACGWRRGSARALTRSA